ncbi:NAD-dependent epimerase/dehydratase family protein [Carnobacterium sp.]|uniref:NAD-dependent epimerase/dehydratase family protein n=1 Tax=Carnobacterium sp. TaxID=48221 RepID=UPI00388F327C
MTKKILITGKNSYVGNQLAEWLNKEPDEYEVVKESIRNDKWKELNFSDFDVIVHVAGLVHRKESTESEKIFYEINKKLTMNIAKKAYEQGVTQFIFLSTISVYGLSGSLKSKIIIDKQTPYLPTTFYGKSKLAAEKELEKMNNKQFKIAIIRPPMIYGKDAPGNFKKLQNLVLKMPIFPLINNQRSMIFVDNLSEFIKLLIDNNDRGLFFPQNREYVNTTTLVKRIALENSKKIRFSKLMSKFIYKFGENRSVFIKLFGNLVIDRNLSNYNNFDYSKIEFEKSIMLSKKNN